ncbi:MAG: fibronectin type III-like domain-contianing protein, partial [Lachnospiraceae bacterium]|nr:fibronectin type III-like domain-contianing protein [Lachnospiraceae bacterium]
NPEIAVKYPGAKFVTTVYEEGLYIGYRYFDTFGVKPAFWFGDGFGYTTFTQEGVLEGRTVQVTVQNTGKVPGKEVVQIYVSLPEKKLEQPALRLAAFAKTRELRPGEKQTVTLHLSDSALQSYDTEDNAFVMEEGLVRIFLGETQIGQIKNEERTVFRKLSARLSPPVEVKEISKEDRNGTWPKGGKSRGVLDDVLPFSSDRSADGTQTEKEFPSPGRKITFPELAEDPDLLEAFVGQMSDDELARLSVGGATGWGAQDAGYAGQLYTGGSLEKYEIPSFYFADGNNGVNLTEPGVGFPVSANMCATWNEELMEREGRAIGTEARDRGVRCILAPAMNLHRNILGGRNAEYFSEDPYLAGRMAGRQCQGLEKAGVAACIKHFFANNAETMRNLNHSIMTERTARELYLGAFSYALETWMPATVMTSYNAANGMYPAAYPVLLREIFRTEMG